MAIKTSGRMTAKTEASGSQEKYANRRGHRVELNSRVVYVHGISTRLWQDLYHRALVVRWPMFFVALAVLFLLLNTAFATLYMLGTAPIANQFPKGFTGAFFFSVETLATVGYGDMHPQTLYGHLIATLEIFVGMSGIALATGLIFARFSRPRAKIMFARNAIVRPLEGRMTLAVRAANARQNVIAEAHAKMRMMRRETTVEGYTSLKIYDLKLVRDQQPMFLLSWIMMHVIDESSPLFGETAETLAASGASLLLTIEGSDETTAQTMQARNAWHAADIRWQHAYVDLIHEEDGVTHVDYASFDDVVPLAPLPASEAVKPRSTTSAP
ncbi:ion channel [Paraburkholderia sp. DHOC27]|uniref:ion channel n=1 Tax=Paraburkholderia sp. DHOC27 TaxID=2303330 RepID=UPI000E3DA9A7|nr:ion channel [Paraburkholderia sp. DHOC27]RFU47216.1 Inward rectifier potassium channel [Paraburkholderia sp. DHOC27]